MGVQAVAQFVEGIADARQPVLMVDTTYRGGRADAVQAGLGARPGHIRLASPHRLVARCGDGRLVSSGGLVARCGDIGFVSPGGLVTRPGDVCLVLCGEVPQRLLVARRDGQYVGPPPGGLVVPGMIGRLL
jgi:hypothetical protein